MSRSRNRAATAAAALVILGIFFGFAGDGIRGFFAPDEMMNLWNAWSPPVWHVLQEHRPVGLLVYRVLFSAAGLNPLPYRIVSFALILANLGLLYLFASRLSRSREVGALACLLGAYHAHLADFYYASAAIFDLLCYFFLFLTLILYFGIRARGALPDWRQTALLLALFVCALGSKEMAVVLPAYIALYEWIYRDPKAPARAGGRFLWLSIPLAILYVAYETTGGHRVTGNPAYEPHISVLVFLRTWKHYLTSLFYGAIRFNNFKAVAIPVLALALALVSRRRALRFAWCVMMIGALPVLFVVPRSLYAIYATLPGWYLFAAGSLVLLRDALARRVPRIFGALGSRPGQIALFAGVALALVPLHAARKPVGNAWILGSYTKTQPVLEQLGARYPTMRRGARLLFLSDPYPTDDYILYFICALRYRDRDLMVERVKVKPELAHAVPNTFDHVFTLENGRLLEVR